MLVATDLSEGSQAAEEMAVRLASRFQARLHVLHVIDTRPIYMEYLMPVIAARRIEKRLSRSVEEIRSKLANLPDYPNEIHVTGGHPVERILEETEAREVDLLILGRRPRKRRLGRFLLGDSTEKMIRNSSAHVLVVKRAIPEDIQRILVPIDFSEASAQILRLARAIARQWDSTLRLLHVIDPAYLPLVNGSSLDSGKAPSETLESANHEMALFLEQHGFHDEFEQQIEIGTPHELIGEAVNQWNPDLLVIGTFGKSGLQRLLLGSTAEEVLHHVPCSVLAVRPFREP